MSTIVASVASSHATAQNTQLETTKDQVGARRFMDGLEQAHQLIEASRPDTVIAIGSNHFLGFFLDMMPAFALGAGECFGHGEGKTPVGPFTVDTDLARTLAFGLNEREFDIALSLRLEIDHGVTHALQYLTPELDTPIVPLVINAFTPPLPSLRRCLELGRAIREVIENDGEDKRVALFASGGLSHDLPILRNWFEDLSDEVREMFVKPLFRGEDRAEWLRNMGPVWEEAEVIVNEPLDRQILKELAECDWDALVSRPTDELERQAGNGIHELRGWLTAAGAAGGPATTLAYSPLIEWHTGMAVASFECLPAATPA